MDCAHVSDLAYGEYSKRLHDKARGQRIPINGSIELTYRCNLRCTHCYIGSYRARGIPGETELSTSELEGVLDQIADAGCLWLLLTGGEPLLRPDFEEVYVYARKRGS